MKDSTSNEFNGTPGSALTSGRLVDALIGKGIQFEDGTQTDTNDYIDVSDLAALDNLSNITVEVSYKQEYPANSSPAYEQTLVSKRYDGSNHSFRVYVSASSNKIFFALATDDTDTDSPVGINDAIVIDTDYCFAGRWKSSYDKIECFLDGVKQSSEIDRIGDTVRNNTAKFVIGGEDYAGTMMRPADGIIDEVRISNAGRADEWIKATSYSNKDNLVTFGSGEVFATNFFDGKIRIKNAATNLLDGKAFIDTFDIDLLDGKARIKNIDTDLLDGKVIVKSAATNLLDGKAFINTFDIDLLDGKTWIVYTGQINGYCPTPTCEMSAIFRYARLEASPPIPTASFKIGRIIEGDCPIPEFTCTAYSGRNPSIIASAPCPTCSMRIGLSFNGDVPIPICSIIADTHHLT
ncbi:MAG: hypothetical protein J7K40_02725, partial [candidate division Zixibacteria bacterium]|nr:hypothetical protein [candidate division Zixibacteria bacterium]